MRIFEKIQEKLQWSTGQYLRFMLLILLLVYVASAIYHSVKPLPTGLAFKGKMRHADVRFLLDQTYLDANGQQRSEQQIFDHVFALIEQAQSTIVLDMFLFNASVGQSKIPQRPLSQQLTNALIAKKQANPAIDIVVITDPINSVYGGQRPGHYAKLQQVGINVVETDLSVLRASNPLWSGLWYMCCQALGNNPDAAWLNNPFGGGKITLRSYIHLFNFKANHRKTLVVDTPQGWQSMVLSANPHDGSSRHSNVALLIQGATAADLLKSEQAVAQFSGGAVPSLIIADDAAKPTVQQPVAQVQVLTEAAIYAAILQTISTATAGQHLDLSMFYLSERRIIQELKAAQQRGVHLRVLLDPNKDAFGLKKNGIPNRPVAAELHAAGVPIRWCDTHGEQCHGKLLMVYDAKHMTFILGSANFTARNLKNYNLETNALVMTTRNSQVSQDALNSFEQAWGNLNNKRISVPYAHYADDSKLKYGLYRFMEWSGLSTF